MRPFINLIVLFLLFLHTGFGQQPVDSGKAQHADTGRKSATGKDTTQVVHRSDSAINQPDSISRSDSANLAGKIIQREQFPPEIVLFQATLHASPGYLFFAHAVSRRELLHQDDSKDGLFYLFLILFIYVAATKVFFERYFYYLFSLFFRASMRRQQLREQLIQSPFPALLMNFLFILTAGLYSAYLLQTYYRQLLQMNFWILNVSCMAALLFIYVGKYFILKLAGWIFNISKATDTYLFMVFMVNKITGVVLLPVLVFLFFSGPLVQEISVTLSYILLIIFFIYRVTSTYSSVRNEIKVSVFQFFMYLCAFEIAPLLLIYKVLLNYLEKVINFANP